MEWIEGQTSEIDVISSEISWEIEADSGKTVSSVIISMENLNSVDAGVIYFDDYSLAIGTDLNEGDITYVTWHPETSLPASKIHSSLTGAELHPPGAHDHIREIADTSAAGTRGEVAICTADDEFYGCTVTGIPGTWKILS